MKPNVAEEGATLTGVLTALLIQLTLKVMTAFDVQRYSYPQVIGSNLRDHRVKELSSG